MALQPTQTGLVGVIQRSAQTAADARVYLAQTLSARVAESEFSAVRARKAAEAADAAAAAAQSAAASALAAANNARTAADAAYAQASAAANAAASANNAAANAANRVAVLELTDLFTRDGVSAAGSPGASESVVPDMSLTADWGPYPLLCKFTAEIVNISGSANEAAVSFGLRTNQRALNLSNRYVVVRRNGTVEISYAFAPQAGETQIYVVWKAETGTVTTGAGRRQFSILRIGTP